MFTGKRAFSGAKRDTSPSKPSSHVSGLNPIVEQIILKCLEPDPVDRPKSAAAVLHALPGGDPLAAAVAAGETPSPQLVADAGDGRLKPWVTAALVGFVVGGVLLTGWLSRFTHLASWMPVRDAEPALMRHKAQEILTRLGHDEPLKDSALRYFTDFAFIEYDQRQRPTVEGWDGRMQGLGDGRPPAVVVFFRGAREPLVPANFLLERETPGTVTPVNPPPVEPGMVDVTMDLKGRLLRFHKAADFLGPEQVAPPPAFDWRLAFAAAELDYEAFANHLVPPRHQPPLTSDERFAWEGPYPGESFDRVRVEAASLQGKPVYFAVEFPWQAGDKARSQPTYNFLSNGAARLVLDFGLPLIAAGLGWWNWRRGRANLRGAVLLGGLWWAMWMIRWTFTAHHVADSREAALLMTALGYGLYQAVTMAIYYLALEPVVRKRWPWRLVSWNRLLAGRVRDPLVGRDILIGLTAGIGVVLAYEYYLCGPVWGPQLQFVYPFADELIEPSRTVSEPILIGTLSAITWFFLIFLVHWVCRVRWLGLLVSTAIVVAIFMLRPVYEPKPWTSGLMVAVGFLAMQWVALRFGLLALVMTLAPFGWLILSGWSLDVGTWFAMGPNLGVVVLLALTLFAAYTATEGRLFGASLAN